MLLLNDEVIHRGPKTTTHAAPKSIPIAKGAARIVKSIIGTAGQGQSTSS